MFISFLVLAPNFEKVWKNISSTTSDAVKYPIFKIQKIIIPVIGREGWTDRKINSEMTWACIETDVR